jgi:hypothetical protein
MMKRWKRLAKSMLMLPSRALAPALLLLALPLLLLHHPRAAARRSSGFRRSRIRHHQPPCALLSDRMDGRRVRSPHLRCLLRFDGAFLFLFFCCHLLSRFLVYYTGNFFSPFSYGKVGVDNGAEPRPFFLSSLVYRRSSIGTITS